MIQWTAFATLAGTSIATFAMQPLVLANSRRMIVSRYDLGESSKGHESIGE